MPDAAAEAHVQLAGVGSCTCNQHDSCTAAEPTARASAVSVGAKAVEHNVDSPEPHPAAAMKAPSSSKHCPSISTVLQHTGPRLEALESLLHKELAELAGNEHKLSKIKHLVEQQRSSKSPAGSGGYGNCQQPHRVVLVLPLLGLTLAQLLALLQQQIKQQGAADAAAQQDYGFLLQMLLKPGSTPLSAALYGSNGQSNGSVAHSSSPFLTALVSEVLRIRQVVSCCYSMLEERVSNIGQYLPPVTDGGNSAPVKKNKRQSLADDTAVAAPAAQLPSAAVDTAAAATTTDNSFNSGNAAYKLLDVKDLSVLHDHASAVSNELVQLDDFINSSYAKLAHLAQQYDTLLTAAATDSSSSSTAAPAATPPAAAVPAEAVPAKGGRGSLLGLLARRHHHQQQQQEGSKVISRSDTATSGRSCEVEFVLMTPGVASHSSCHPQAHKYTAGVSPDLYHQTLHKLITTGHGPEPVIWGLSIIYARIRHAAEAAAAAGQSDTAAEAAEWKAPDQFTRRTTKYWVHPSNILRLKLALLRHLPLLVYGSADPVYRGDVHSAESLKAGGRGATSLVSSVYLDSPNLDVYHTRLARDDMARLVRLRYYGPRQLGQAGQQQPVFVERKTHRQKWTGNRSIKERANLVQGQVCGYLTAQLPTAELSNKEEKELLLTEVLDFVNTTHLAPAVRTEYLRTAWQRYDSNAVRLSLDEHMLLLREKQVMPSAAAAGEDWCAAVEQSAQLAAVDVVRFPYGILEIKLQEEEPEWIQELRESGIVVECPKFSKFLHGMALLYPQRCANSPRWFIWDDEASTATPATIDQMRDMNPKDEIDETAKAEFLGINRSDTLNSTTTLHITAAVPAVHSTAPAASLLPSPALAPLRIPRLESSGYAAAAAALPATAATLAAAAAQTACSTGVPSYPVALGNDCNSNGYPAGHSNPGTSVLCGVGMHTPMQPGSPTSALGFATAGFVTAAASNSHNLRDGVYIGGAACRATYAGFSSGSGPFNAGINSSIDSGHQHHIAGSPATLDTATLLPKTFRYSDSNNQRRTADAGPPASNDSYTSQPIHDIILDNTSSQLGHSAAAAGAAAAPAGCSPTGRSSSSGAGSIRRLVGMMMGVGRKNRISSSSDQQLEGNALDACERRDTTHSSHHILQVTNPLEIHHIHSRHHHHHHHTHHSALSSCSTCSQDTFTNSSAAARHSHGGHSRTSSSLGLPSINGSTPTAANAAGERLLATAAAVVAGAADGHKAVQAGSSNTSCSWQLATEPPTNLNLLALKSPWGDQLDRLSAPAGSPADAFCRTSQKLAPASGPAQGLSLTDPGWNASLAHNLGLCQDQPGWGLNSLAGCKDTARPGLGMSQLMSQQIGSAAQQQHHVIQVNHVRRDDSDLVQPDASHLQQYLPPVSSNGAAAGLPLAAVAAADDGKYVNGFEVHINGDISNSSGGGGSGVKVKRSRAKALLQQIKAAAGRGRWRGKGKGSGAGAGGGNRNEHMLGFAGSVPRTKAIVRARAEPKTFFANERTFLNWLQISVLVMMTGLGLLGGSSLVMNNAVSGTAVKCMDSMVCGASRISGAIIAPVSVLFMLYALYNFKKRTHQIRHQMTTVRYDDQLGPVLLTVLLVAVTVVSMALALKSVVDT